jgi:phospholipid/cholesterol/gamma-HCH transport system permease protein
MNRLLLITGAPWVLFFRTIQAVRRAGLNAKEVLVQLSELGSASTVLIGTGLSFFGAVMVTIAWIEARKYTGNITVVGPAYFQLLLREMAPLIVAVLVASRAGAAMSAELASMSVNEQLDALELSAANPLAELVAPRVIASVVAVPALTIIGTAAAALAAAATVTFTLGADGRSFLDPRFVQPGDLLCSGVKSALSGTFIPLSACWRGLRAKGGAAAVGEAVTVGVVDAIVGCLMIDFAVALAFLLVGL